MSFSFSYWKFCIFVLLALTKVKKET